MSDRTILLLWYFDGSIWYIFLREPRDIKCAERVNGMNLASDDNKELTPSIWAWLDTIHEALELPLYDAPTMLGNHIGPLELVTLYNYRTP